MALLRSYAWPGNVRELEHFVHRALIFTRGYPIQASDLPPAMREGVTEAASGGVASDDPEWLRLIRTTMDSYGGSRMYEELLEKVERLLLTEALQRCQGNQTHAARLLGLARPTLHAKLDRLGLRESREPGS